MALTKCTQCGGMLSTYATICPHCGNPVELPEDKSANIHVSQTAPGNQIEGTPDKYSVSTKQQQVSSRSNLQNISTNQRDKAKELDNEQEKTAKTVIYLVAAIFVAILLGIIGRNCLDNIHEKKVQKIAIQKQKTKEKQSIAARQHDKLILDQIEVYVDELNELNMLVARYCGPGTTISESSSILMRHGFEMDRIKTEIHDLVSQLQNPQDPITRERLKTLLKRVGINIEK